jgi:hypothetical protein
VGLLRVQLDNLPNLEFVHFCSTVYDIELSNLSNLSLGIAKGFDNPIVPQGVTRFSLDNVPQIKYLYLPRTLRFLKLWNLDVSDFGSGFDHLLRCSQSVAFLDLKNICNLERVHLPKKLEFLKLEKLDSLRFDGSHGNSLVLHEGDQHFETNFFKLIQYSMKEY